MGNFSRRFGYSAKRQESAGCHDTFGFGGWRCIARERRFVVASSGLSFVPTNPYKEQLTTAGATPAVVDAVSKAAVHPDAGDAELKGEVEEREHLALAGKLIRNKEFEAAATEINEALRAGGRKAPSGFVMGELLRRKEDWSTAAAVFEQLIKQVPDFPEARTKLSFVLYRAVNQDDALREAKAVLHENPSNAEAHKDAGLALLGMSRFDAAEGEFREALRLKPDYENIYYDLGNLLYYKKDMDGAIEQYKKALVLKPRDIDVHTNLALAYEGKKEYGSAIRELREAKQIDPKDVEVRQNLGHLLIPCGFER